MRRLVPLLLLAACSSTTDQPVDERAQPIVGGTIDTGDPPVVALTYLGQSFCSGTLVAPEVVITAAHCIDPVTTMGLAVEEMDVFFGTDTDAGGTSIHLISGQMHPAWNNVSLANDIACVRLAGPSSVTPARLNTQGLKDGDIGKVVRIVGFGVTAAGGGGGGTKRQALSMITGVDDTSFMYGMTPGQTCFGDSGGPGFMTMDDGVEYLTGVTSAGDEGCIVFGIDTRIDAFVNGFIQPCIDATNPGGCGADGVCKSGCSPPDPDCSTNPCRQDGTCEPDCPTRDPDCFCVGGDGYCDLGCPTIDPDCTGDIPMGQPCGNDRECLTGLCIHAVDDLDFRYCTRSCTSNESVCSAAIGIGGAAMPCTPTVDPDLRVCAYQAPSPGVTGSICVTGADCWSGLCLPAQGGICPDGSTCQMCTRGCLAELGADCALGYSCQTATVGADELHVCLPAPPAQGWCSTSPSPTGGRGAALVLILAGLAMIICRHERRQRQRRQQQRR